MKLLYSLLLSIAFVNSQAQKVGIGNTNPNMRLHVSSPSDTALLQIDNNAALANNSNVGLYMKNGSYFTGAIKTTGTGTNVARMGFYTFADPGQNGLRERLSIADNGNVGINNNNPQAMLDVNGTVKISGGAPGAGKVLTSDATGNASWQEPQAQNCFPNVKDIFTSLFYTQFTVPANVTRVFVQMWGSGGKGSAEPSLIVTDGSGGGGGGGAYTQFYLNVTPGSLIEGRVNSLGSDGKFSTILRYNGDSVRAFNGDTATFSRMGRGGTVILYGPTFSSISAFSIFGQDGMPNMFTNYTLGGVSYTEYVGGDGGGSYRTYGQRGQVTRVNNGTGVQNIRSEISFLKGIGAGGGAITRAGGVTTGDNSGGSGRILIYY